MNADDDWGAILNGHPIFDLPRSISAHIDEPDTSLELSSNTLPKFTQLHPTQDEPTPSGRRQVMVLKDADIIVAARREVRMTSLGDSKLARTVRRTYKTLHTPNVQFEIHQISLNPSGKLLAVAGAFQVAVIVLPRAGFMRLVPDAVDCKSLQVGQYHHASTASAPIVKIEWHPWGEAGSTLMVMTADGKLREYDISADAEDPQQTLSFVPEKRSNSFVAEDPSEREVTSFTLGKGRADWGPFTIYAIMKSGDIYSICPYIPQNASIPSSYIHSLECFISAKQEFLSQENSAADKNLSTLYDYQHKYVTALLKQLPPGTVFPSSSRSVLVHPPATIKSPPLRQGPFLLQPSPRIIEGSEGGDATDISYMAFGDVEDDESEGEGEGGQTEHLGVIMVAFQDGKVDLLLDVEKVEARWETKTASPELPMLAVYETIDLGLVSTLNGITSSNGFSPLELLQGNHPVFLQDPIHDDTIYVYHAFGVHALNIGPVLQSLTMALRADDDFNGSSLDAALQKSAGTSVHPILTTFSVERKCSNPVVGVTIPNDVYLTYSIFILTSAMRITSFPLNLRTEPPRPHVKQLNYSSSKASAELKSQWLTPLDDPAEYISLLREPYTPPEVLSRTSGLPTHPRLSLPPSTLKDNDFKLTPDTLRYFGTTVKTFCDQILEIQLAVRAAEARVMLQRSELARMSSKCREMECVIERLKGPARMASQARFGKVQSVQKVLLGRMDRMLQGLMERASPELSEHETKWFEELKRIRGEISGAGRYDEGSLTARIRLLEREYARLTPSLKELVEKDKKRSAKLVQSKQALGQSQVYVYEVQSRSEQTRISHLQEDILQLAAKLDVPLSRPPSTPAPALLPD